MEMKKNLHVDLRRIRTILPRSTYVQPLDSS